MVDLSMFLTSLEAWYLYKKEGFYAVPSFTNAPVQQALFLFRRFIPNNNNSNNYGEPYIPIHIISSLTNETI